jgi:hypothetical protein
MNSSTKKNIVLDNAFITKRRGAKRKNTFRAMEVETQTLLQQQHIKEKQLLKQWKAARAIEKKTRLIVRKQAHDVSRREKQRFSDMDDGEYDEAGCIADRYVWKHTGCDEECKADNCLQYMLEFLSSGDDYFL